MKTERTRPTLINSWEGRGGRGDDSRNRCLIHAVNVCEVYYDIYRRGGEEDASALEEILATTERKPCSE